MSLCVPPIPPESGAQLTTAPCLPYTQVKTPVLLMLGQEDRRVPFKQGMEYYRALKARNVPVR